MAIPSFLVMLVVYIFVGLAGINTEILTLPMSSIETIVDEAAQIATIDSKGRIKLGDRKPIPEEKARQVDWKSIWSAGTDAVMDVPLAGVCEVLYGDLVDSDDDEYDFASH